METSNKAKITSPIPEKSVEDGIIRQDNAIGLEYYLVKQSDKQFFVIVTNEFIESRQLAEKITEKKFEIGNFSCVDCGIISDSVDNRNTR